MFDPSQRRIVLNLARTAIASFLNTNRVPSVSFDEFLKARGAAFVTLKIQDELRGCIGSTDFSQPLGETIVQCAISAAFRDPRFPPLVKHELDLIDLEVSLLSNFRRIDDPEKIIAGTHGVMISKEYHRGLLLPQVATEYDWDRDTFLSYTCRKAGLNPDAWKDPDTIIEIFEAEVFGEKDSYDQA